MLNRCFVLSFLLVLSGAMAAGAQVTDAAIVAIRAEYQRIWSSRATYKTRSVDLMGESAEGGVGTAYYDGKNLKLLAVTYYGETGKREAQYYYREGEVFFALSSDCRYNRPFYYNKKIARESGDTKAFDPNKSVVTESRYYFQHGKLIRWLDYSKKEQPVAAASKNEGYQNLLATEINVRTEFRK